MKTTNNGNFEPVIIISNALSGGGAEKSMLALHQEFMKTGINCYLIALNESSSTQELHNTKVLNRKWGGNLKDTIFNFLKFKALIRELNPKVIIANCELSELYVSLLYFYKTRIICVEHTSKPWNKKKSLGVFVRILLKIKKIEWITVNSNREKIWLGKKNPKYIANPYIDLSSVPKYALNELSLVFIGGLKDNKRPEWVIEAGIRNCLPINLYGDGTLGLSLKEKYSDSSNLVKFHGFKSNVWEFIPRNTLVVVPSEYEGDGMVIIEAIIRRIPLALSRNKDLIRFGIDEKHFFNSLNDLVALVEKNKFNNFKNLIVDDEFANKLSEERSLNSIVGNWIKFLKKPIESIN
jgi:hypothetical protein